jgi:hypothetical protein
MAQKKFNHAKAKISGNEFQLIRKRWRVTKNSSRIMKPRDAL